MKRAFHFVLVTVLAAEALVIGQGPDAAKVLADVRAALGGDANLAAVTGMSIQGRSTRSMGDRTTTNDFEMAIELPDKFVKKEVIAVVGTSNIARTSGFNGEGLIEVVDTPPSMGGGMFITRMSGTAPGGMQATPEQIEVQRKALLASNKREFARLALGMFAASSPVFPVEFTYAGEAESPDGKAYVIDVKGADGFAARLFVDSKTRLPLMLTWMDKEPLRMTMGPGGGSVTSGGGATVMSHGAQVSSGPLTAEQVEKMRKEMEERAKEAEATRRMVEYRVFYGDYKPFAGVQLPTRIQRMIDGKPTEELSFEKIKINPKFDSKKFEVTK
jgi:hypothetical protein